MIEGKVVLVTGATDGLGRALAHALAAHGATVLVHGRAPERSQQLARALGGRAYVADLASLAAVRQLADELLAREPRLDVLVNNAGVGAHVPTRERAESRDGVELRFAVNYLAHYVLTRALIPLLKRSVPARIVNVSSVGQAAIDFDDPLLERDYSGPRAYCQSKLAQIMFTIDLAGELASAGITVNALHPATYMPTKIVKNPLSTLEEGVEATMRLISDDALGMYTGKYFDRTREAIADPQAYDAAARAQLHALSERLAHH